MSFTKMIVEISNLKSQIQRLQADKDELEVYRAYCLYQMDCLRTLGEDYSGPHILSFSRWHEQQEELGYIIDNKFKDST